MFPMLDSLFCLAGPFLDINSACILLACSIKRPLSLPKGILPLTLTAWYHCNCCGTSSAFRYFVGILNIWTYNIDAYGKMLYD